MSYRLLIVGHFDNENTSVGFFSWALADRFARLGAKVIRHHFTNEDLPNADVALFHTFETSPAVRAYRADRSVVSFSVSFLENRVPYVDTSMYYMPDDEPARDDWLIPPPVIKSLYRTVPKTRHSILLDHDVEWLTWSGYGEMDWNKRIWDAVRDMQPYLNITQLERGAAKERPAWIKTIPVCDHEAYLQATETFETFVVTHKGSFNHTAVDMAIRGSRVLVPTGKEGSFIRKPLMDMLQMTRCGSLQQLIDMMLNTTSVSRDSQMSKTIDLDDVVKIIHTRFKARFQ